MQILCHSTMRQIIKNKNHIPHFMLKHALISHFMETKGASLP